MTNFTLIYHHNKDIRMWDDMIPWEKELYLTLMIKEIEDENLRLQLETANSKATGKRPPRRSKRT